uniref:Uncharacterized protein n=1 Tax=Peronospora matthiolae TaxID=2874970 RepID=A0AAV1VB75_9STRA
MLKAVISGRDKSFTSQSSAHSVATGITTASGMSSAFRAVEASKERESGFAAADKLVSEECVAEKAQPELTNEKPERYSNDPFYLGMSSPSSSSSRTISTGVEWCGSSSRRGLMSPLQTQRTTASIRSFVTCRISSNMSIVIRKQAMQ